MRPEIPDLLPLTQVQPGSRVLDLGCGPGSVPYASFPRLQFFGIDQFVHPGCAGWPKNAVLTLADGERLPFPDGFFDAVLVNFVFEHLARPEAVLHELDRVVREDGLLYLSIPRHSSIEDRLYRLTFRGGGHVQRYTFESFLALVYGESGFKLDAMLRSPAAFTWLRTVPFGDWLHRWMFRGFRYWARATGHDPLNVGAYLLLFRLGRHRGLKRVARVCSLCGCSNSDPEQPNTETWKCPVCGFANIRVTCNGSAGRNLRAVGTTE